MKRKAPRPAIEIAAVAVAAASIGGAIGFAVWCVAPLGAGMMAALAAGVVASVAAWLVVLGVDRPRQPTGERFVPVDYTVEPDILLLDQPIAHGEPLLLDDPLPALDDDSRVVRLFAAEPAIVAAAPGEMIARIEDFLGHRARGSAPPVSHDLPPRDGGASDASAALHAALADIRRSLRHRPSR